MVKHTQAIRRQQPTNCLSVFGHFMELVLKGLSLRNSKKLRGLLGPCQTPMMEIYVNHL